MSIFRNQPYGNQGGGSQYGAPRRRNVGGGLLIAVFLAGFALCKYYSNSQLNEITGETQHVSITPEQEIALGLNSYPAMIEQFGGLHPDAEAQKFVKGIGQRIVQQSDAKQTPYQYDFHLLYDPNVVNAFALPGGQVFITQALFNQLETEDQLAGVFGHEIGHVVARHGAERIAKQELTQGLTGAAVIASGDYQTAQAAQMIASLVNMSYGRDQELQSDDLGVRFMVQSGYDPEALIGVMQILEKASGGSRQPEFMSTHPSPENRVQRIRDAIAKYKK
ncbi:MAG TPA: M48 family metallopeptidase [Saprospiraceae bacterium]|jgi:predicted Zn-dependent protease